MVSGADGGLDRAGQGRARTPVSKWIVIGWLSFVPLRTRGFGTYVNVNVTTGIRAVADICTTTGFCPVEVLMIIVVCSRSRPAKQHLCAAAVTSVEPVSYVHILRSVCTPLVS